MRKVRIGSIGVIWKRHLKWKWKIMVVERIEGEKVQPNRV